MKACEKCGFLNANDCLFCERCGNDLTNTQDKRNVLWGLAVPILIAAALLFTYRDRLPIGEKKDTDIQKTVSEEGEPVSAKQQEKDLEVEEAADGSRQKDLTDGSQQEETGFKKKLVWMQSLTGWIMLMFRQQGQSCEKTAEWYCRCRRAFQCVLTAWEMKL